MHLLQDYLQPEKNGVKYYKDSTRSLVDLGPKKGGFMKLKSLFALMLVLINLNNVKFVSFFKRKGFLDLEPYGQEPVVGFSKTYWEALTYNIEKLKEIYDLDLMGRDHDLLNKPIKDTWTYPNSIKQYLLENLLESFLEEERFDLIIGLRNRLFKTKFSGLLLNFRKTWAYDKIFGRSNRPLDVIISSRWADMAEPELLDSRFFLEAQYRYKERHGRSPMLFFNFFKHGILHHSMWPVFYSAMRRIRDLSLATDKVVQMREELPTIKEVDLLYPMRVKNVDIPVKISRSLEMKRNLLAKRGLVRESSMEFHQTTQMGWLLKLITIDLPIIFSTFTQLNYLVLLLFAELFGDFFQKNVTFAANLYRVRIQMEQQVLFDFKSYFVTKIFWFLLVDLWFLLFRFGFSFIYFFRFRVLNANVLWFLFSYWLNLLVFFLQYLNINDRSVLSIFYLYVYKDFFKFKFSSASSSHLVLKNWGFFGHLFESCVFVVIFFFLLVTDLLRIFIQIFLRISFISYVIFWINIFFLFLFRVFFTYVFNPVFAFIQYCEDFDLESRRFKKQQHLNFLSKGPLVLEPVERVLVGFIFWKTLVKKYWWDVVIEHEVGLKRWPFFYKFSRRFAWFDTFVLLCNDIKVLASYFFRLVVKRSLKNVWSFFVVNVRFALPLQVLIVFYKAWVPFFYNFGLFFYRFLLFFKRIVGLVAFGKKLTSTRQIAFDFSYYYSVLCYNFLLQVDKGTNKFRGFKFVFRRGDINLFSRLLNFYRELRLNSGFFKSFSFDKKNINSSKRGLNFEQNGGQFSAVRSLYVIYGEHFSDTAYKRTGLVSSDVSDQIRESVTDLEGCSDYSILKTYLWVNGLHKIFNKVSGNLELVLNWWRKGSIRNICIFPYRVKSVVHTRVTSLHVSNVNTYKMFSIMRYNVLRSTSFKLAERKSNARFWDLDKFLFFFFCSVWERKLSLLSLKQKIKSNFSLTDYLKLFGQYDGELSFLHNHFRQIVSFLNCHQNVFFDSVFKFFNAQQSSGTALSFLSFLKNKFDKGIYISGNEASGTYGVSDFVSFCRSFASYRDFYDLKFKLVSFLNDSSFVLSRRGSIKDISYFYMRKACRGVFEKVFFKLFWVLTYEWRLISYFIDYFALSRLEFYNRMYYRYNAFVTFIFDREFPVFKILSEESSRFGVFRYHLSGVSVINEEVDWIVCAKILMQSLWPSNSFKPYKLNKFFDVLSTRFLKYLFRLSENGGVKFLDVDQLFFVLWQHFVFKTTFLKCKGIIWNYFVNFEVSVFSDYPVYEFCGSFSFTREWLIWMADVFGVTLVEFFRDDVGEEQFWRSYPNSSYKGVANISFSLNAFKAYIKKCVDMEVRRLVSAVRLKKKGELVTDDEMFLRNYLGIEEEHLSLKKNPDKVFLYFIPRGNHVKRVRVSMVHELLWVAAQIRFFYQQVTVGFDEKQRVDVFLENYPEFKPLLGEELPKYLRASTIRRKKRERIKFLKTSKNVDQTFLNILPDLWFVSRKFLKMTLWKEHFFFKFWIWWKVINSSNYPFYIYFFFMFFGVFGLGLFSLGTFKGLALLFSWVVSWLSLISSILYMFFSTFVCDFLGINWSFIRANLETFFYFYVLTPDLQSVLVSLNLYDVFLFLMHNLVQYEADIFVKERIVWLLMSTIWIFVTTFFFDFYTICILALNFVFSFDFLDLLLFGVDNALSYFESFSSFLHLDFEFLKPRIESMFLYVGSSFSSFVVYTFFFFHKILSFVFIDFWLTVLWQVYFILEYGCNYLFLVLIAWTNSCDVFFGIVNFDNLFTLWPELINYKLVYKYKFVLLHWIAVDIFLVLIQPLRFIDFARFCGDYIDIGIFWFLDSYFPVLLYHFSIILWCFLFVVNTMLLLLIDSLIFLLDCYLYCESVFNFVWCFLFKDIVFSELILFIGQCLVWFYLNFIYYMILQPFAYLIGCFILIFKFFLGLPNQIFAVIYFVYLCVSIAVGFLFDVFVGIFSGAVDFVIAVKQIFIYFVGDNWLSTIILGLFSFFYHLLVLPFKLLYWFFTKMLYVLSPMFLINFWFGLDFSFVYDNWDLFWVLCKEFFYVVLLVFKLNFEFLRHFIVSAVSFVWLVIDLLDALFPSLKHMFDPFGGISIFYATVYYYIFVFCCYIWSLSYRAFNDTSKLPPMPSEVWKEVSEQQEDHPLVQRLPFDLYQLFYIERVSKRKLPAKFRDSLKTWTPAKQQMKYARLIVVKNTPLNAQGYYYRLMNGVAKRVISRFYKKRSDVLAMPLKVWESTYNRLGIKEFIHNFKEFPTDLLDTISVYLRFEEQIKMDKPLFQHDRKKSLSQRLHIKRIWDSLLLIHNKEEQERIERDLQLLEQEYIEYYGGGEADEVIFTFPILGRIFSLRDPREDRDQYRFEVVQAGWRKDPQPLSFSQKEIKKKFLAHVFFKYNRGNISIQDFSRKDRYQHEERFRGKRKSAMSSLFISGSASQDPFTGEWFEYGDFMKESLEYFRIKKYKRINILIELEGDSLADPLFLTVRTLDVFLYPILVFATVNTGWWYPGNGFSDAVFRLASIEDYARDLVEIFERPTELDLKVLRSSEEFVYSNYDSIAGIELFQAQEAVERLFPTQNIVDKYWEQFAKEYPELDTNFDLFVEQDPYYFFKTFSSYVVESNKGVTWVEDLIRYYKRSWNTLLFLNDEVTELDDFGLEALIKFKDDLERNKDQSFLQKDFELIPVEKEINFKQRWTAFLEELDSNGTSELDKAKFKFLNMIYNSDFLGFAHYLSTTFEPREYVFIGANTFNVYPDLLKWSDKAKVEEEDEYTKHRRLYDQVAAWEAEQARQQRVAAIKKLAEDEGFETDTDEGRRMILKYALEHNIINFDFEDEMDVDLSKLLDVQKYRELTEEELELLERKGKERFEKVFNDIFQEFDGKKDEGESESEKKRREKWEWFQKQLERFESIKHPLLYPDAKSSLKQVYHTFQWDPGFFMWSRIPGYADFSSFVRESFDILDRGSPFSLSLGESGVSLLLKHDKGLKDYYLLDEYFKSTVQFLPNYTKSLNKYVIPIMRPQPLPEGTALWDIVDFPLRETMPQHFDLIQRYLDLQRDQELLVYKSREFKPYAEQFPIDLETFTEDLLLGHTFYEFYTTGFLSFFKYAVWKRVIWTIYKVYEGTLIGDIMYEFLHNYFSNSLLFGAGILPRLVVAWDPHTRMYLADKFMHGDLAPFRRDFYSAYTSFSFYTYNSVMQIKRGALDYFKHPELFSDTWFLRTIPHNFFIVGDTMIKHVWYASYETRSIFHMNEGRVQLKDLLSRFIWEDMKMFVRWGLYVWFYASEFLDAVTEYFSTYALFRTLYDLVVSPFVALYNASMFIYGIVDEARVRLYRIYIYLSVNLRLFENIYYFGYTFVARPVINFFVFTYNIIHWNILNILNATNVQFWEEYGFNTWWKKSLMRYLFLSTIHFSVLISEGLVSVMNYKDVVYLFISLKDLYALPFTVREFFAFIDAWFESWTYYTQWYLKFVPTIKSFLVFSSTVLPTVPVVLSFIGNFILSEFSLFQVVWQFSPKDSWYRTLFMLESLMPALIFVMDLVDAKYRIYDILYRHVVELYGKDMYLSNSVNHVDLFTRGVNWESILDSSGFMVSIADVKGLLKTRASLYGMYRFDDFRKSNASKPYLHLQDAKSEFFMLREAIHAPYSFAIADGLIVLSRAEERFLSSLAINNEFSNQRYLAYDFLSEYNEGYKSNRKYLTRMTHSFAGFGQFGLFQDPVDLYPASYFTFDVGSNFYANLKTYETELGIRKLRYFFNRYQWLVSDIFPYTSDIRVWSDIFIEMCRREIPGMIHMRFVNTKQMPELSDEELKEVPVVRIATDIYGNFIYYLEGPDWMVDPDPTFLQVLLLHYIGPVIETVDNFYYGTVDPFFVSPLIKLIRIGVGLEDSLPPDAFEQLMRELREAREKAEQEEREALLRAQNQINKEDESVTHVIRKQNGVVLVEVDLDADVSKSDQNADVMSFVKDVVVFSGSDQNIRPKGSSSKVKDTTPVLSEDLMKAIQERKRKRMAQQQNAITGFENIDGSTRSNGRKK